MAGHGSRTAARVAALVARARPRPHTALAGGAALVVVAPLALAAVVGVGHAQRLLDQTSGAAWVVSPQQGLVTLLDGASETVVVGVRVPGAGHALSVVQGPDGAYLVDDDAGTVSRLDAATFSASAPVALGTPGSGLSVLQNDPTPGGRHVVHVLDEDARTATHVDPRTLEVDAEVTLTAQPGPGQAVVDDTGDLWAVDAAGSTLTRVAAADDARAVRRTRTATSTAQLVLVRGAPVLVDPARAAVHAVGDDARPGPAGCLETRPADDVQVLGSTARDEVYVAVAQARALLVASTTTGDCARSIDLAGPSDAPEYGALAQSGRYVFVPDTASGTTAVVDTAADTVLDHLALTDPGHRLELHAQAGFVFFNDLDGHTTGVLTLAGGVWQAHALQKYDPTTGEGAQVVAPPDERPQVGGPPSGDAPEAGPHDAAPPADPAAPGARPTAPPGAAGRPGTGGADGSAPGTGGATRATPTPSVGPTPSPSASPQLAVSLGTDPPSPGQPEYEPLMPATVVATVSGAGPGADWRWTVTSDSSDQPTFTLPAAGRPLVLDSVGSGDVTVRLTVTDGERSASAELVLWVTYECHLNVNGTGAGSEHVADLRNGRTASFTVEAHECRGDQIVDVTLPGWITGPTQVTAADDGSSTVVDLQLAGPVPGDGPQSGTSVRLRDSSLPALDVAVETDVAPRVTSAQTCQIDIAFVDDDGVAQTQWVTVVVVEVVDAVIGRERHVVVDDRDRTLTPEGTSGATSRYVYSSLVVLPTGQPAPEAVATLVTVNDGFGKTTGEVDVTLVGVTPSPCFGGG